MTSIRRYLLALAFAFPLTFWAATLHEVDGDDADVISEKDDERCWLVIEMTDGRQLAYVVPDKITMEWATESITLVSRDLTTKLNRSRVAGYHFTSKAITDGILTPLPESDLAFSIISHGVCQIVGLQAQSPISVFTVNGVQVQKTTADGAGTIVIDLTGYPSGVYLIHVPDHPSIKVFN